MVSKKEPTKGKTLPPNAGKGRPKGSTNKVNAEVKSMIRDALEQAGGVDYLVACAHDPKTKAAFLSLVGKLAPMTLAGDEENPLKLISQVQLVALK